ncbi:MAG: hypothetical protein REI96_12195 [Flavobacterium nitrogenifigens]|uniref:hypothetical protein n=1 Tax=Flavobacterium nitrogenifigens TaxID=1617283 RepID=UPI002807D0BD|nr:hypothetical protein [Flavobacterium nitrogenifigens]MDQ8013204.1 hypothetical protein [Flavobacterium nitrogenifigens]
MKKIYPIIFALFLAINLSNAQTRPAAKEDVIIKTNGEEIKGKIIKISDEALQFVFSGESLEYTIKKSEILRIVHSSGRVEILAQTAQTAPETQNQNSSISASQADHHNKIAVLPFGFLVDQQPGSEEIGYKAQEDTYAFLMQHSAGYTVLDTHTTNSLLIKNGITRDKMRGFTMKEICDVLGVEYLVDGTITQNKAAMTTSSSGYSDTNVKRNGNDKVKNVNNYGTNNSYTMQRYDVSVSLAIYMDTNASIYNQSHKAFLTSTDASYNSPLEYLIKRCPLYRK